MKKYSYSFIALLIFFSSCEKEELPIEPHDSGDVITSTVSVGSDYRWQVYYDLETNTVVGQNLKTAWDLAFECNGENVFLNSSKIMYAWNTQSTNFSSVTDTIGFYHGRGWDEASGNSDSTAIGNWQGNNFVYVIDRGYDESGIHQGFRKIQFLSVNSSSYSIRFAELNGNGDTTFTIPKDTAYNFTFLSFQNNGSLLQIEPPKHAWDLVFTQYTHIFYDEIPVTPYLVTGCLLNSYQTSALLDSNISFENIDFNYASGKILSPNRNSIGYDWKEYIGSTYVTKPQFNYIIQDANGILYKLHFIDFYDNTGEKGNPKWEIQQL